MHTVMIATFSSLQSDVELLSSAYGYIPYLVLMFKFVRKFYSPEKENSMSKIDDALRIRNAALFKIGVEGAFENTPNIGPRVTWTTLARLCPQIHMDLRLPAPVSLIYSDADGNERRKIGFPSPSPLNLPWGLDIWTEKKVLNIEWNAYTREVEIVSFRRGSWEKEILSWINPVMATS